MQANINRCLKPAAWQLPDLHEVLDTLLESPRSSGAAGFFVVVASSSFLTQLADWMVLALGMLLQACEDAEVSWLYLVCQLAAPACPGLSSRQTDDRQG